MSDYCNFCYKPLLLDTLGWGIYCPECNVSYSWRSLELNGIITWNFIRLKNGPYALQIMLIQKTTTLFCFNQNETSEVICLPFVMKNITRHNIQDKVKTLLMFS